MDEVLFKIAEATQAIHDSQKKSRELSTALTKLDEARLWVKEHKEKNYA